MDAIQHGEQQVKSGQAFWALVRQFPIWSQYCLSSQDMATLDITLHTAYPGKITSNRNKTAQLLNFYYISSKRLFYQIDEYNQDLARIADKVGIKG